MNTVHQRTAGQVFQRKKGFTIPLTCFENGGDCGMVQRGDGLSFTMEAGQCSFMIREKKLEGDDPVQPPVTRSIYNTVTALAAKFQDFVIRMFASGRHDLLMLTANRAELRTADYKCQRKVEMS